MRAGLIALRDRGSSALGWLQLVHEEGDRHPINRLLEPFVARLLMVAACCAALVVLERHGYTDLLAWTDRVFPASRYPVLFGGFVALYGALALCADAWRKPLLLVASLAAMAYFDLRFAVGSLAFFATYYAVVYAPIHRWLKLFFLSACFAALAALANLLWFPGLLRDHPWIAVGAYAFAVNYTFRIFYFFHEAKMRKFKRAPFVDFLLYFLFAPYFVIVPYMFAIPRFGVFARSIGKRNPVREASGVRYLLAGVAMIVIFHHLNQLYAPREELMVHLRHRAWAQAVGVGLLYYPIAAVLSALGVAYVLTGMLRVLGADVSPPFQRALGSTSIHEWWRRWNVHFRDFLVDIFFYPLMIRWRKRNPYLTIVVGCISVFLVGSTIFHWIGKYYFQVGSHENIYWSILVENLLMCIAVAGGLCLEKRRILRIREHPPTPPPKLDELEQQGVSLGGWFGYQATRAAKLAGTYLFLLIVVVFAGYGATYTAYHEPVEATDAPFTEALAAVAEGDRVRAGELVSAHVPVLRSQSRAVPREPLRRLRLAFAYSLPGPWLDPAASRRELQAALRVADPKDSAQAALLAHLWPAALRESAIDPGGAPGVGSRPR